MCQIRCGGKEDPILQGGVSVSDKAVHQDQGDRNVGLDGDESVEMMNSE